MVHFLISMASEVSAITFGFKLTDFATCSPFVTGVFNLNDILAPLVVLEQHSADQFCFQLPLAILLYVHDQPSAVALSLLQIPDRRLFPYF